MEYIQLSELWKATLLWVLSAVQSSWMAGLVGIIVWGAGGLCIGKGALTSAVALPESEGSTPDPVSYKLLIVVF